MIKDAVVSVPKLLNANGGAALGGEIYSKNPDGNNRKIVVR